MKNPSTQNTNTRIPVRLAGNTDTRENTAVINNVRTYQHAITATNQNMSRKTSGRESGKKKQITTRTKITRRNAIIEK